MSHTHRVIFYHDMGNSQTDCNLADLEEQIYKYNTGIVRIIGFQDPDFYMFINLDHVRSIKVEKLNGN